MNDFETLGKMLQDEGFQPRLLRGGGADLADDAWSLGFSNHSDHLGWEILVGIEEYPRESVALFLRKFDDEEGCWMIQEMDDATRLPHAGIPLDQIRAMI